MKMTVGIKIGKDVHAKKNAENDG